MRVWQVAGRSSAWLERLLWEQEVARSNRVAPTNFSGPGLRLLVQIRKFGHGVARLQCHFRTVALPNSQASEFAIEMIRGMMARSARERWLKTVFTALPSSPKVR